MKINIKFAANDITIILNQTVLEYFNNPTTNREVIDDAIFSLIIAELPKDTIVPKLIINEVRLKVVFEGMLLTINDNDIPISESTIELLVDKISDTSAIYQHPLHRSSLIENIRNIKLTGPGRYDVSLSTIARQLAVVATYKDCLEITITSNSTISIDSPYIHRKRQFSAPTEEVIGEVTQIQDRPYLTKDLITGVIKGYKTIIGPATLLMVEPDVIDNMLAVDFDLQYKFNSNYIVGTDYEVIEKYTPPVPVPTTNVSIDGAIFLNMAADIDNPLLSTIATTIIADILVTYKVIQSDIMLVVTKGIIGDMVGSYTQSLPIHSILSGYKGKYERLVTNVNNQRITKFNKLRMAAAVSGIVLDPKQVADITSITSLDLR